MSKPTSERMVVMWRGKKYTLLEDAESNEFFVESDYYDRDSGYVAQLEVFRADGEDEDGNPVTIWWRETDEHEALVRKIVEEGDEESELDFLIADEEKCDWDHPWQVLERNDCLSWRQALRRGRSSNPSA